MPQSILLPVVVLVAWSLVMCVWLYATRIPAMRAAKIDPEKFKDNPDEARAMIPPSARQVADNYNHLMEQPTIFYALALALALSGEAGSIDVILCWAYVGLRIAHSVWQGAVNVIMIRFLIFLAATLVLFALAGRAIFLLAG